MPSNRLTKCNLFCKASHSPATHWVWLWPGSEASSRTPACRRLWPATVEKDCTDAIHPLAGGGIMRKAMPWEVQKMQKKLVLVLLLLTHSYDYFSHFPVWLVPALTSFVISVWVQLGQQGFKKTAWDGNWAPGRLRPAQRRFSFTRYGCRLRPP